MTKISVIMPTFNNIETLRYSIPSVLNQSYEDFELCVIGDGCPQESKSIVADFMRQDSRLKFFDFEKGARHGELHRHAVISQLRSPYVTYLSDDDLYTREHLHSVTALLDQGFEFVHTLCAEIIPTQHPGDERFVAMASAPSIRAYLHQGTLSHLSGVKKILQGTNFISLSNCAHTRSLYERLPFGWRVTPDGIPTDLYMWQQFLSIAPPPKTHGSCRLTHIHLAKFLRKDFSVEERLKELSFWSEAINDSRLLAELQEAAHQSMVNNLLGMVDKKERIEAELFEKQLALATLAKDLQGVKERLLGARIKKAAQLPLRVWRTVTNSPSR